MSSRDEIYNKSRANRAINALIVGIFALAAVVAFAFGFVVAR